MNEFKIGDEVKVVQNLVSGKKTDLWVGRVGQVYDVEPEFFRKGEMAYVLIFKDEEGVYPDKDEAEVLEVTFRPGELKLADAE